MSILFLHTSTTLLTGYVHQNDLDDSPYSLFNLETPTFANGTTIRKGTYRVLLRALRVTGDPTREEDYESWLSPILGIST